MTTQDNWLYIHTTTADAARRFFGLPAKTEVQRHREGVWAVRAPAGVTADNWYLAEREK